MCFRAISLKLYMPRVPVQTLLQVIGKLNHFCQSFKRDPTLLSSAERKSVWIIRNNPENHKGAGLSWTRCHLPSNTFYITRTESVAFKKPLLQKLTPASSTKVCCWTCEQRNSPVEEIFVARWDNWWCVVPLISFPIWYEVEFRLLLAILIRSDILLKIGGY